MQDAAAIGRYRKRCKRGELPLDFCPVLALTWKTEDPRRYATPQYAAAPRTEDEGEEMPCHWSLRKLRESSPEITRDGLPVPRREIPRDWAGGRGFDVGLIIPDARASHSAQSTTATGYLHTYCITWNMLGMANVGI